MVKRNRGSVNMNDEVTVKLTKTQVSMLFYALGYSNKVLLSVPAYQKEYDDLLDRLWKGEEHDEMYKKGVGEAK